MVGAGERAVPSCFTHLTNPPWEPEWAPAASLEGQSCKTRKASPNCHIYNSNNPSSLWMSLWCMGLTTPYSCIALSFIYSYRPGVVVPGPFKNTDRNTSQLNKPNYFPRLWLWFHQHDFEFLPSASMLSTYGLYKHVFKVFSKFPKWTLEEDNK